jgi:hypothetical protein
MPLKQDVTEALHFDGPVLLDILLARRSTSREMLARAKTADIQFLLNHYQILDMERIKWYADVFNQWSEIEKLRSIK